MMKDNDGSVMTDQESVLRIWKESGIYAETCPPVLWTGAYLSGCFKNIYLILMYHGLHYVGLLRALYTSCYCHSI